jgi:hypothetical protein
LESRLTSLGRVGLAYPGYARFNKVCGFGSKKKAHGLTWGKGGVGLQSHAIRGEVNGSREVFSLVTLYHKSHRHLDPLALRRALKCSYVLYHAIRIHVEERIINGPCWGSMKGSKRLCSMEILVDTSTLRSKGEVTIV